MSSPSPAREKGGLCDPTRFCAVGQTANSLQFASPVYVTVPLATDRVLVAGGGGRQYGLLNAAVLHQVQLKTASGSTTTTASANRLPDEKPKSSALQRAGSPAAAVPASPALSAATAPVSIDAPPHVAECELRPVAAVEFGDDDVGWCASEALEVVVAAPESSRGDAICSSANNANARRRRFICAVSHATAFTVVDVAMGGSSSSSSSAVESAATAAADTPHATSTSSLSILARRGLTSHATDPDKKPIALIGWNQRTDQDHATGSEAENPRRLCTIDDVFVLVAQDDAGVALFRLSCLIAAGGAGAAGPLPPASATPPAPLLLVDVAPHNSRVTEICVPSSTVSPIVTFLALCDDRKVRIVKIDLLKPQVVRRMEFAVDAASTAPFPDCFFRLPFAAPQRSALRLARTYGGQDGVVTLFAYDRKEGQGYVTATSWHRLATLMESSSSTATGVGSTGGSQQAQAANPSAKQKGKKQPRVDSAVKTASTAPLTWTRVGNHAVTSCVRVPRSVIAAGGAVEMAVGTTDGHALMLRVPLPEEVAAVVLRNASATVSHRPPAGGGRRRPPRAFLIKVLEVRKDLHREAISAVTCVRCNVATTAVEPTTTSHSMSGAKSTPSSSPQRSAPVPPNEWSEPFFITADIAQTIRFEALTAVFPAYGRKLKASRRPFWVRFAVFLLQALAGAHLIFLLVVTVAFFAGGLKIAEDWKSAEWVGPRIHEAVLPYVTGFITRYV